MSAQGMAIANSSPLSRATIPRRADLLASSARTTARSTRSPLAWPSMSLMLLEAVEAEHQQRDLASLGSRRGESSRPVWRAACCGWQDRSACRVRPDSGSVRLRACAPRCRAGSRHTGSRRCPASRKSSPRPESSRRCLRRPSNSITVRRAGRAWRRRRGSRTKTRVAFGIAAQMRVERTADHLRGLIAEDRGWRPDSTP